METVTIVMQGTRRDEARAEAPGSSQSYHLGGAAVDLLGDDEHRHDEVAALLPLSLPLVGLPQLSVDGAGMRGGFTWSAGISEGPGRTRTASTHTHTPLSSQLTNTPSIHSGQSITQRPGRTDAQPFTAPRLAFRLVRPSPPPPSSDFYPQPPAVVLLSSVCRSG